MNVTELDLKLKAGYIRTKLEKGWPRQIDGREPTFLRVLRLLPDACLVEMDRLHSEDAANHAALMQMYRAKQQVPKDGDRFKKLCAAAVSR